MEGKNTPKKAWKAKGESKDVVEGGWHEKNHTVGGGRGVVLIVKYEIVLQKGRYWVKMW